MIKKWVVQIPELSGKLNRRVYIYLPESYEKQPDARYPVLYMFDGHNVFYDRDATFGKSWGMRDYMRKSRKQLIIVAVECNHEGTMRLQEYSPHDFEAPEWGMIRGRGAVYMNWLVKTLKPYIDAHYRTLPGREHTSIAGSSMGGLMSLYAICAYGHIFKRAACLSPSLWTNADKTMQMIGKAKFRKDTCIYMDYGSEEMGNHYYNASVLMVATNLLLSKKVNLTMRIVPGGTHSEASWEKQIPVFMECLGL